MVQTTLTLPREHYAQRLDFCQGSAAFSYVRLPAGSESGKMRNQVTGSLLCHIDYRRNKGAFIF
jgi:hypothetical protein